MHRTPEEIDEFIRSKMAAGSRPSDIASHLSMPSAFVRKRMTAMGIEYKDPGREPVYRIHPMWGEADLDIRRMEVWQRQHDGARDTLRGLR